MAETAAVHVPVHAGTWQMDRFETESGAGLEQVKIAYETYGVLSPQRDNGILLCHALTGDAGAGDFEGRKGWWGPLVGPGRALDTDRYFVVCSNVLGGCAGSTGPSSLNPKTGRPYGSSFPAITIRDMVRAQQGLLREAFGIDALQAVVGGSMGGMQALEWAVMYPDKVERAAVFAATPAFSAMGIAYNEVMRQAIVSDPDFFGGDYAERGTFPAGGLRIARMLGMITYRTAQLFDERYGRRTAAENERDYEVARYLRHHGDKLVRRFDANSYLALLGAMDGHDLGRGRGTLKEVFSEVQARMIFVAVRDDLLYPPEELRRVAELAAKAGVDARYAELASPYGHDAFLLEAEEIHSILRPFLD